ncbi:hypothetical protein BD410DRAFT_792662 [Rickenella mellea]|uniref:Ubiquitin-like domain-containing protein n=1 Tax=Rickenella mellea TaxID=50990 RepID=A0A4Y7PUS9_9AGAM|nr:hypothetical protein BD410DRAFT_792662 [Rickenella mellea]
MPKATTTRSRSKASQKTDGHPESTLLILQTTEKKILIPRPKSYEDAIKAVKRHFPAIYQNTAMLRTDALEICESQKIDVTPECWADLKTLNVNALWVETRDAPARPLVPTTHQLPFVGSVYAQNQQNKITILMTSTELNLKYIIKRSQRLSKVFQSFSDAIGACEGTLKFSNDSDGTRLSGDESPEDLDMEDGDSIFARPELKGGKPVIYLTSPFPIDATVTLGLISEWTFSVVHPFIPIKNCSSTDAPVFGKGQRIKWQVTTQADGTLLEKNTDMEVAYLFWEAHTNSDVPPSPPSSPTTEHPLSIDYFSPVQSNLYDSDCATVALPIAAVAQYLDKSLKVLGLHVEARTSFVTYWLPSLLKHKFVALRFVPQAAYERAAPLAIEPRPDIVTRVFMLFKGIPVDDLLNWSSAIARADEDVRVWQGIVGVDEDKFHDARLFRVLEWGGMEILR